MVLWCKSYSNEKAGEYRDCTCRFNKSQTLPSDKQGVLGMTLCNEENYVER